MDTQEFLKFVLYDKKLQKKFKKLKTITAEIQATEGIRSRIDALNWAHLTNQLSVRKNNFKTYSEQVQELRNMYYGRTDYGNSLTRAAVDIRTSFIAGEGISITGGSKKATADWIKDFLKTNSFEGSGLLRAVKLGELEGKCLAIIKKVGDTPETIKIKVRIVSYTSQKYTIETDEFDNPIKVSWEENNVQKSETAENFEYLNYSEFNSNVNDSPPPAANVIQQLINYERALYDLRENNHLFGRVTPVVRGDTDMATNAAIAQINSNNWTIGKALGITGDLKYLTPGTDALESLRGEMSLNLKLICAVLGIPVHWAGWTDLMSNRATAETLSELVETLTKEIRLKWIQFFINLIRKAMIKSEKYGADSKDLDGFDVELPQITAEKIKELIEAWFILAEAGYIAKETLINKLPGVDPEENKKALERQRKEEEKNKPQAAVDFEQQVEDMEEPQDNE